MVAHACTGYDYPEIKGGQNDQQYTRISVFNSLRVFLSFLTIFDAQKSLGKSLKVTVAEK